MGKRKQTKVSIAFYFPSINMSMKANQNKPALIRSMPEESVVLIASITCMRPRKRGFDDKDDCNGIASIPFFSFFLGGGVGQTKVPFVPTFPPANSYKSLKDAIFSDFILSSTQSPRIPNRYSKALHSVMEELQSIACFFKGEIESVYSG